MPGDPFHKVRVIIEKRVNEQLDRHFSINPNADPKKIIELQIQQEKEHPKLKLERLIESEEEDHIRETALRYIIDEWLPDLERKLKRR